MREELDRDVARARHLHDRRRLPAVEHDVGVREVVHHQDVVLARERDDPLEERRARRIARSGCDGKPRIIIFGFGMSSRIARSSSAKKSTPGVMRHRADVGAGDDRRRRCGSGSSGSAPAPCRRGRGVASIRCARPSFEPMVTIASRVRIELDAVAALVPVADRAAQPRDALRHRVAVRVGALRGLDQLVDDVRRRRAVGVAHAEVDDVFAAAARGHLQLGGDVEDVRRQALDAREVALARRGHGAWIGLT